MVRASSRAAGSSETEREQAGMSAGGEERMWSLKRIGDSGSEPELEGEPSTRDEIEHVERGHKRQTVQTPATTRHSTRSLVRQTRRLLTAAAQRSATGNAADAGAVVGSSMILSQMPAELLETVLSYLSRGPQESSTSCWWEDTSGGDASPLEAGSPTFELQNVEQVSQRSTSAGKGSSSDLAPVQVLFKLCALTCRRWNTAVRSPQVLGKLSMVRFPLPAAAALSLSPSNSSAQRQAQMSVAGGGAAAAAGGGSAIVVADAISGMVLQAGDELLDARVETILRVASKAGNDSAQFVLGLYLSRQKTFALLCLVCPATSSPAAEDEPGEHVPAYDRQRTQEQLRGAVLDTYDEGVQLLRTAADQLHPNALYQLGMLAFGGTDVKLRSRLFGHDGNGGCGDCVLGEEHAELYWRRAAELGHLESRLIVDGDFRLNHLQELEDRMQPCDAERRSWRLCAGNRLLSSAKRPQSSLTKARECSHEECGMYTLLCEFKQCAGCATSHKKQR